MCCSVCQQADFDTVIIDYSNSIGIANRSDVANSSVFCCFSNGLATQHTRTHIAGTVAVLVPLSHHLLQHCRLAQGYSLSFEGSRILEAVSHTVSCCTGNLTHCKLVDNCTRETKPTVAIHCSVQHRRWIRIMYCCCKRYTL